MTQDNRRVAVVIGASSGIGAAVARTFAASEMKVALAARREDSLEEVHGSLAEGAVCTISPTDVTDRESVKNLIRHTEDELGPPDILVNCAGVMYYTMMKNLREDEWARTVEVGCNGLLNAVGAALPGMLARGRGHIVTISSDAGRKPFPGLAVYSGVKAFAEFVSQGLRLETAGTGLKVTTIQPGNTATDLLNMSHDEEAEKIYGAPTGARILDPKDVADAVLYAVSQPDHVSVNEVLVEPREEPI